jgi:hypothetical protein
MSSASLIPIKIRSLDPANLGSADAEFVGTGDDGQDYVIKTIEKTPDVPAAEWFCHRLADLCGIAVPHYCVLTMPRAAPAFGSRFDGSAVTDNNLKLQIHFGVLPASLLGERLSAIHAFDLFVGNNDRHGGNYLFVRGMKNYSVQAFDFSRAWTQNGWPIPDLPLDSSCNTMEWFNHLLTHHRFNHAAAQEVLTRIRAVSRSDVKAIYDKMPLKWCAKEKRKAIVEWWSTKARLDRLEQVELELKNGRYK